MVNWAVWAKNSAPSAGLRGSWYFNWATSSFRKASLPSDPAGSAVFAGFGAINSDMGEVVELIGVVVIGRPFFSGEVRDGWS